MCQKYIYVKILKTESICGVISKIIYMFIILLILKKKKR